MGDEKKTKEEGKQRKFELKITDTGDKASVEMHGDNISSTEIIGHLVIVILDIYTKQKMANIEKTVQAMMKSSELNKDEVC
jgi:hypothetical protein